MDKIAFAQHIFDNVQELIRFLDQKSQIVLVIAGVLSAGLFSSMQFFYDTESPPGCEKYLVAGLALWFLVHIGIALWHSLEASRARPDSLGNKCGAPELIFPLLLLKRYRRSQLEYRDQLRDVSELDVLSDYSHQITENANIYEIKQGHVNRALDALRWSLIPWLFCIGSTVVASVL